MTAVPCVPSECAASSITRDAASCDIDKIASSPTCDHACADDDRLHLRHFSQNFKINAVFSPTRRGRGAIGAR
jgi:hypothetical protein